MNITGTCEIDVWGENKNPIDERTLRKIENELTEKLSEVVDEHLAKYGLENQQVHSCLVNDLDISSYKLLGDF